MRARPGLLALFLSAAAATGISCTDAWRSVTYLEGFRMLAVRASPPDLAPGEATQLDALVIDPRAPTRTNTLIWLACDPDPAVPGQSACADYDTLLATAGGETSLDPSSLPEGVRILGMSSPPGAPAVPVVYQSPAAIFEGVAADSPLRLKGVLAIVLVLAIGEAPPASFPPTEEEIRALLERVKNKEVDSLLGVKRLRISENPTPNHNPQIAGLKIATEVWGSGLRPVKLHPGTENALAAVPVEGTVETYQDLDVDGVLVTKEERLIASWFTTLGDLKLERSLAGDLEDPQTLHTPFLLQRVPEDRRGTLYLVLRDGRGGVDTLVRGFFLCDPFRDAPTIASVEPASGPAGTLVKIRGTGLEDVLDVQVGAGFLAAGRWDAAEAAFVGSVPSDLAPGEVSLIVRGKGCNPDPQAAFTVVAP